MKKYFDQVVSLYSEAIPKVNQLARDAAALNREAGKIKLSGVAEWIDKEEQKRKEKIRELLERVAEKDAERSAVTHTVRNQVDLFRFACKQEFDKRFGINPDDVDLKTIVMLQNVKPTSSELRIQVDRFRDNLTMLRVLAAFVPESEKDLSDLLFRKTKGNPVLKEFEEVVSLGERGFKRAISGAGGFRDPEELTQEFITEARQHIDIALMWLKEKG